MKKLSHPVVFLCSLLFLLFAIYLNFIKQPPSVAYRFAGAGVVQASAPKAVN